MERIPLHPGTHLTDRQALERLKDAWVSATPPTRAAMINNIWNELELFGECYNLQGLTIDME